METLDLRKELKYLYQPSAKAPTIVDVPRFRFLTVEGIGGVGATGFQGAISALFSLAYPVRFGAKKELELEYPVMPLEGLYWDVDRPDEHVLLLDTSGIRELAWKLMMMIPEAVPEDFIEAMRQDVASKKDLPRLPDVKLEHFEEGTSVQIMYVGPYEGESPTIEAMIAFAEEHGYAVAGRHHEIYIGDPNRSAPEKLKTVLRYGVRLAE